MRNRFAELHPAVLFLYFTAVILFSMFFMHPVFLAISLFCGFACSAALHFGKTLRFSLRFLLPMLLVMTAVNPLLNHRGATILLYVNDNPVTREALLYGFSSACMFSAVLLWFSCWNTVITSDKLVYLFGSVAPSLSLLFSMVLRFVPRFKAQIRTIENAQKGIGKGADQGSILIRAKNGMHILSILTTWALENGITTADSMRARGYGLAGRTSFSIYKFNKRDKITLIVLIVMLFPVFYGAFTGENNIRYYPSLAVKPISFVSNLVYAAYFLLCAFPLLFNAAIEVKEHDSI